METDCVRCKKNTVNENYSIKGTKQNRLLLLVSNCTICGKKKSTHNEGKSVVAERFIKTLWEIKSVKNDS